ncbi:MAG: UPF0182 family protein [Leptolyngbyaceae bacterium]|nr:UPF0182 family protein [Leptolyngbyaceae bacterium]
MKWASNPLVWLISLFVIAILSLRPAIHLLTESWWFETVGFEDVFWTRIIWQLSIGFVIFILYAIVLWGNYRLAMSLTRTLGFRFLEESNLTIYGDTLPNYVAGTLTFIIALGAASVGLEAWETILQFLNPTMMGRTDPIYGQDISFYLFELPFWKYAQYTVLSLIAWSLAISLMVYGFKEAIRFSGSWQNLLRGRIKVHISLLLVAIALVVAVGFWFDRYELLYSADGVVFGGGYTDVHARLHSYWILGIATLILMGLFAVSLWLSNVALPVYGIGVYLVLFVVVGIIYPWFQQKFVVAPNELDREMPYITHNIELTRDAYGLATVERKDYPANTDLTQEDLENNQSTISNIRLWTYQQLLSTYRELQEFRRYYQFTDVDVDRYVLDGDYRQVMLASRELNYEQLRQQSNTWVNQHLQYTHGYGVVASPVNQVTSQGLPEFFIKDIPPESSVDLELEQPALYYGEGTTNYVFTGMSIDEFDYPQGNDNTTTRYDGVGGVPIGSWLRRAAYSFDLGSLNLLISDYFTDESKVLYHRQLRDRLQQIAPFLLFDSDPYITILNGRLQWIVDAYTVSDRYPYAEPFVRTEGVGSIVQRNPTLITAANRNINYIRNSVKAVVDAYDGTMQFFVVDESDPIAATYQKIFPTLFEPSDAISPDLKAHFRYPPDLFRVQAQMYLLYHMSDPTVFYNREDVWSFPTKSNQENATPMEPYYVIMQLPEEGSEEFILILPFTPNNKGNMISWLSARSDGEQYGKLLLYEFPKQDLVYGPNQVEARIDQNPSISSQITLWDQQGSEVIRDDLLVIPIEGSLLYIKPVYLSAEQRGLPELKRVIVTYDTETVMATSLDEAFRELFGDRPPSSSQSPQPSSQPDETVTPDDAEALRTQVPGDVRDLAENALEAYQNAQNALRDGNWSEYGRYQEELESLLQQLSENSSDSQE